QIGVNCLDRGVKEFTGRQGELVSQTRPGWFPRPTPIEAFSRTPCASELLIKIVRDSRFDGAGILVGGNQSSDSCLDELRFLSVKKEILVFILPGFFSPFAFRLLVIRLRNFL